MKDSTKLFGGFDGSETNISQRNWAAFNTILDAHHTLFSHISSVIIDFGPDYSGPTIPYHCRLDGFKVTGAVAYPYNSISPNWAPAPIRVGSRPGPTPANLNGSTADIVNCLIINNAAEMGAGVGIYKGNVKGEVRITNCRFENNTAQIAGGAIFKGNTNGYGGLAGSGDSSRFRLIITDCSFKNNTAPVGGAIALWDSATIINRCTFSGNTATIAGAAIYDTLLPLLSIYNSEITGNVAPMGAAIYSATAGRAGGYRQHTIIHSTIATNVNTDLFAPNYAVTLCGSTDSVFNSILWDNVFTSPGAALSVASGAVVQSNVIQAPAFTGGTSNYTFNPFFKSPGSSSAAPFPLIAAYDYRLRPISPAVDTAINLGLAAPYNLDRNGSVRVFGPKPDLGAYELSYCPISITVATSGPTDFCMPGSVTLVPNPRTPANTYHYYWNGSLTPLDSVISTSGGTYRIIGTNDSLGCRTTVTVVVRAVASPNPVITIIGDTLKVPAVYASYQWYKNGVLVPGATGAAYLPASNGIYSVKVTSIIAGCPGTSNTYNLFNLASPPAINAMQGLRIYPNPAAGGRFSISLSGVHGGEMSVTVADITDHRVFYATYHGTGATFNEEVDLSFAAKGMFFVRIAAGSEVETRKIVID